jgi:hypothetical protein
VVPGFRGQWGKGDRQELTKLTDAALAGGKHNVAFLCLFLLGQVC